MSDLHESLVCLFRQLDAWRIAHVDGTAADEVAALYGLLEAAGVARAEALAFWGDSRFGDDADADLQPELLAG